MRASLCQEASSDGAAVLLTGLGGDQFLEGSRAYDLEELAQFRWRNLISCFNADARHYGVAEAATWFFRYGAYPLVPASVRAAIRRMAGRDSGNDTRRSAYWLTQSMYEQLIWRRERNRSKSEAVFRNRGQQYLLDASCYAFDTFSRELSDRLSAESGLEVRHPFYSTKFVQFAFSTPERLRLRKDCNKYIHVQGMGAVLPKVVAERRTKADFSDVFANNLYQMERYFTEGLPVEFYGLVRRDGVNKLFQSYKHTPQEGWQNWVLWNIFGCVAAVGAAVGFKDR
jgi:asparagine synthase (glutamine-hydrolysing)